MDSARAIFAANLRRPEYVAEVLDAMQYTACAGLLHYPEIASSATAHLFWSESEPLYLTVFLAVKRGQKSLQGVLSALLAKGWALTAAESLAGLYWHPVTKWRAESEIRALKKFMAWQYRQEKKRRATA